MQIPWQATDSPLDPHLAVALLLSAVVHAVILLILGFTGEPPPKPTGPVLHMVEYQPKATTKTDTPDPGAKAASQSQAASGQGAQSQEATSPRASRNARDSASPVPPTSPGKKATQAKPEPAPKAQAQSEAEPAPAPKAPTEPASAPPTLTAQESAATVPEPETENAAPPAQAGSPSDSFQLFPSDREVARWDRKQQERKVASQSDRTQEARAATREDAAAAYINSFLGKVQRIGNMNYPEEAQERDITGRVRVEVVVRADGSLATVRVLESSGSDILDAAAKQIIRMGAPYSRFPDDLKGRYEDGLPIRHYFNFTRPQDKVSQARS
jgi:protein TonB